MPHHAASPPTLTIIQFDDQGTVCNQTQLDVSTLDSSLLDFFRQKLSRLSGDLDLPLESELPEVSTAGVEFRIVSDLNSACTFYYLGDEIIYASLTLRGADEAAEAEMSESIRLLLLEEGDDDEPDDEEIERLLASNAFPFDAYQQRPIHYAIDLNSSNTDLGLSTQIGQRIQECDRHLAIAFCMPSDAT